MANFKLNISPAQFLASATIEEMEALWRLLPKALEEKRAEATRGPFANSQSYSKPTRS